MDGKFDGFLQAKNTREGLLGDGTVDKGKSLLGNFNHQVLYDWDVLVRLYEKQNLKMGDMGRTLAQLTSFEIPGLKRQLGSFDKQLKELLTRE